MLEEYVSLDDLCQSGVQNERLVCFIFSVPILLDVGSTLRAFRTRLDLRFLFLECFIKNYDMLAPEDTYV